MKEYPTAEAVGNSSRIGFDVLAEGGAEIEELLGLVVAYGVGPSAGDGGNRTANSKDYPFELSAFNGEVLGDKGDFHCLK